MSRAFKHFILGGLIIMTTGISNAAAADQTAGKPTIVNPKTLYDPTPNGYSTAVIVPAVPTVSVFCWSPAIQTP